MQLSTSSLSPHRSDRSVETKAKGGSSSGEKPLQPKQEEPQQSAQPHEKGAVARSTYGSVITTLDIEPTARTAGTYYDACPFLVDGGCGACIERCPSGAITREGKNTAVCSEYLDNVVRPKFRPRYGCAKCQTGVPCEFARPS